MLLLLQFNETVRHHKECFTLQPPSGKVLCCASPADTCYLSAKELINAVSIQLPEAFMQISAITKKHVSAEDRPHLCSGIRLCVGPARNVKFICSLNIDLNEIVFVIEASCHV
jgi:hypothetical protein